MVQSGFGRRFDVHDWPAGQRGGLMLYPLSGVLRGLGCVASNALTALATNGTTYQFTVEPGAARLDSVLVELPSALNVTLTLPYLPVTGANRYRVYVNPVREVPAVPVSGTPPTSPAVGDRILRVVEFDTWQQLQSIQEWNGMSWVDIQPVYGPSEPNAFSVPRPVLPAEFNSHNNMPLNRVRSVPITAGQISARPELPVYHGDALPPSAPAQPRHWLRMSAALWLCDLELKTLVTPLQVQGVSTNGSNVIQGDFTALLGLNPSRLQELTVAGPGFSGTVYINTVAVDGQSITVDNTSGPGGAAVNAGAGAGAGVFTIGHPSINYHLVAAQVVDAERQQRVLV